MDEFAEISFRANDLGRWLKGKLAIHGDLVAVTAPDGRVKTAHIGGSKPEGVARLLLRELHIESPR